MYLFIFRGKNFIKCEINDLIPIHIWSSGFYKSPSETAAAGTPERTFHRDFFLLVLINANECFVVASRVTESRWSVIEVAGSSRRKTCQRESGNKLSSKPYKDWAWMRPLCSLTLGLALPPSRWSRGCKDRRVVRDLRPGPVRWRTSSLFQMRLDARVGQLAPGERTQILTVWVGSRLANWVSERWTFDGLKEPAARSGF